MITAAEQCSNQMQALRPVQACVLGRAAWPVKRLGIAVRQFPMQQQLCGNASFSAHPLQVPDGLFLEHVQLEGPSVRQARLQLSPFRCQVGYRALHPSPRYLCFLFTLFGVVDKLMTTFD